MSTNLPLSPSTHGSGLYYEALMVAGRDYNDASCYIQMDPSSVHNKGVN